ncbi:hypothetical protein Droror1_Dr00005551 [Drosera rotundifolia]
MASHHEEFHEPDIVFSDDFDSDESSGTYSSSGSICRSSCPKSKKITGVTRSKKSKGWSVAIDIPRDVFREDEIDQVEEGEGGEMVPPHVIISRRFDSRIARSFYENGRSLKGRNLCRVRDSVLRMTGFIEC